MSLVVAQFMAGLASASALFLVAVGLSVIFGVTRIVNFAHGSFYMLGAYLAVTLADWMMLRLGDALGFWLALPLAALACGLLGLVMEFLILRRLYHAPELLQLLATFGVVLLVQDATLALWGPEDRIGPRAPGAAGSIEILGTRIPEYDLVLIAAGPAVLLLLLFLFRRTRWGVLVRAATEDREMLGALGVSQKWLFASVIFLGTALAGLAGALQLPRAAISLGMDLNVIAEAFVVVVVGGMGSIGGAFLAALIIGELSAFGILIFPKITLVLLFLIMAVTLVIRPQGLLGRAGPHDQGQVPDPPLPLGREADWLKLALAVGVAALLVLPFLVGDFAMLVLSEVFVFALFAASLQLLIGQAGLISFGHAAYFGLGAYGSALLVHHFALPMEAALFGAPLLAALGALVFGWFCMRLAGVYLAMLTLAFAQIAWSVAFQWVPVTGGDNGLLGIWPSPWASGPMGFYYLALGLVLAALGLLWRMTAAPLGLGLRACRDSRLRAEALGLDPFRLRWLGFVVAGAFAGLAGGLYAFLKGTVFPDVLGIPTSVDALVMVLLGGVQTLLGPLLGAALIIELKAELVGITNLWRAVIGGTVIVLVLLFPHGVMGSLRRLWDARRAPSTFSGRGEET